MTTLRERWAGGDPTLGAWLAIPSVVAAETTARTGFDYVCADLQHGALDYADSVGLFQAVLIAGSTPIARVPWNEPGVVGKVLDAGAEAVIVPMVNTAEQAVAAVRSARYPPLGARSYGPTVCRCPIEQLRRHGERVVAVIPMIETRSARPPRRHPLGARGRCHLRRSGGPVAQPRAPARETTTIRSRSARRSPRSLPGAAATASWPGSTPPARSPPAVSSRASPW